MKKVIISALVFIGLALFGSSELSFKPVSPRKIKIGNKSAITLIQNGRVNFEVVAPENPAAKQAAEALIEGLQKISGSKITMVKNASGKVPAFILGMNQEAVKLGLNPETLDRDGFFIKTAGNNIYIVGVDESPRQNRQSATLFGVYDFLERFAGVRYYFPGEIGTIAPQKKNWSIPEIDIIERPDTQFRWIYCYPSKVSQAEYDYPGKGQANNLTTWRNSSLNSVRSCHGLNDLELSKRFAKTHPEYFALASDGRRHDGTNNKNSYHIKGHLCYSSEGLKEVVYQDAVACLTGKPASSRGISGWSPRWNRFHVNITPNDGVIWCQCPKCKRIQAKGKQAMSDHIWNFVIDIAQKLKKNNIPGKILMDSYGVYSEMPTAKIPDNIFISVAVTGPWDAANKKIQERDDRRICAWSQRMNAKIGTWTYPTKASAAVPLVPNFTPRAVAGFYKRQKPYIYGGFFEAGSDRWLFGFLNAYVYSKLLWDWNTDVEKLIAEHCTLMYGPAAAPMDKIYQELERIWLKEILQETIDTSWGTNWLLPTRREVWTKIYSPEKIAGINKLFDAAEKAASANPQSLKRVKFMRKELWSPVVKGADAYQKESSSRSLWTMQAGNAEKIVLDGVFDEPSWKKAKPIYLAPAKESQKAEVQTKVRFLQDAQYFYIGIESGEPDTAKMVASHRSRKDDSDIWRDNGIEIFLSSTFESKFIYQFIVNSAGAKSDLKNMLDKVDEKYDTNFETAVKINPGKNWCAELRIPRKSMPELSGDTLVANFTRSRVLKEQSIQTPRYIWRPWSRNIAENCGLVCLTAVPDKNLIKTGDFDRPIVHKRFIGGGEWGAGSVIILDNELFLTAGTSLRLEGKADWVRQNLPLKPNGKYRLSFYVKTQELKPGMRALLRFGSGAKSIYVLGNYLDYIRGTTPWQRIECTFTTPEKFGSQFPPHIEFGIGKSSGKCWLDHVELLELKK